jgi:hypothetical protein
MTKRLSKNSDFVIARLDRAIQNLLKVLDSRLRGNDDFILMQYFLTSSTSCLLGRHAILVTRHMYDMIQLQTVLIGHFTNLTMGISLVKGQRRKKGRDIQVLQQKHLLRKISIN